MATVLVRLISSADHAVSRDELVKTIETTGTDRYDATRKQQFDDFYAKHDIDFFATPVDESEMEDRLKELIREFSSKTASDRGRAIAPDIAIIYYAGRCKMMENIYNNTASSDCYQFIGNPLEALSEVRLV